MTSPIGTWTLKMNTPMGEQTGALSITEAGDGLAGTITGPDGEVQPVDALKQDGDKLSWKLPVKKPIPLTLHFDVTIEGDSMTGKFRPGMFPASPVTGTRV